SLPPEDSVSGTKAAARGGITTMMEMPGTQKGCFSSQEFIEKRDLYEESSYVDFCIHAGCASGYPEGTLTDMWRMGATGIKFFIASAGPRWPQTFDDEVYQRFEELSRIDALALIHSENDLILRDNLQRLQREGRKDYTAYLEWRPPISEAECGQRMIRYLKETGCRGLIVHTSIPEVIKDAAKARVEGVEVYVETCPQYLYFTDEDVKKRGPWLKFAPPARSVSNQAELWKLINEGLVETLATDHAPYSKARKEKGLNDIFAAPNGLPGLEVFLPLMLTAVNQGKLSLTKLVSIISENPARLFRITPRKGFIQPDADADLVIVDLEKRGIIRADDQISACGWTPYDGLEIQGEPIMSMIRGKIVMKDGKVIGKKGQGTFISRID
ncbi:MAG: dihydroorotase, partial [Candidatus Thorarchaeota archaeon]